MSRIRRIFRIVWNDYKEFRQLHQPMAEPWKKEEPSLNLRDINLTMIVGWSKRFVQSFRMAFKVWKLQLTNSPEAIKLLDENKQLEKTDTKFYDDLKVSDETVDKLKDNAKRVSDDAVNQFKTNTSSIKSMFGENKQNMKEFAYERLKIISDALRSFNLGYAEGKAQGYEDGLTKSPEDIIDEVVVPMKEKISSHIEKVVNSSDVSPAATAPVNSNAPKDSTTAVIQTNKESGTSTTVPSDKK